MMVVGLVMLFLMGSQPIFMIGILILIVLLYCVYMCMHMGSYWFSYALMMVMLSGVLVIFMYMISLFPNESFEIYNLIFMMFIVILFMSKDFMWFGLDYSFISLNLWTSYVSLFNLFLVSFLLSIMLMVVWVSCVEKGAVRTLW